MNKYFDSLNKIGSYVAAIATRSFYFNTDFYYPPKVFKISPTFWRDYTCPPMCGGCCRAFSMDFFEHQFDDFKKQYPNEAKAFEKDHVYANGERVTIYSNRRTAESRFNTKQYCQFLNRTNGRCTIHEYPPLSCRFELNKLQLFPERDTVILGKKLYRNGWRYGRIDGGVGALCEMVPLSQETINKVMERDMPLIEELTLIADNIIGVENRGQQIVELLRSGAGQNEIVTL